MQFLNDFDSLIDVLRSRPARTQVAVVCPYDEHTREAVTEASRCGIADFILVGEPAKIGQMSKDFEVVPSSTPDEAAAIAVDMARNGKVQVIMKGLINTDNLLRAILNKTTGILPAGNVLSHVTVAEIPDHNKLLVFSDAAVIPYPTEAQLISMTANVAFTCRCLGNKCPHIALIHCTEKTSPKFPVTLAYSTIKERAASGYFGDSTIDGPMDLKTAFDAESAIIKGIDSHVAGHADALIFPDIEAANVFYKTLSWLTHSTNAGMLLGAAVPVVLPSRSDSARSKLCSLAIAATCATK